jgi:tRNA dimethylallyltransferase
MDSRAAFIPPSALDANAPAVRLVAGPTASGKSALALGLAEAAGGVIVNADSMQLYADLRVLTARPSAEEEARAPHRLYGVADGAEAWSVGRWLRAAAAELAAIAASGRPAVVVGGTGLYFRALTQGLADVPPVPEGVRAETQAAWDRLGERAFRDALRARDPDAEARIFPGDRQRLTRAFEVFEATGRALSAWQAETAPLLRPGDYAAVVVEPARDVLYARCDQRFDAMLAHGALDEVRALAARGLDPELPVMKALGVRELVAAAHGTLPPARAIELAKQETRRYAKRQSTWFRNQTPHWPRVDGSR